MKDNEATPQDPSPVDANPAAPSADKAKATDLAEGSEHGHAAAETEDSAPEDPIAQLEGELARTKEKWIRTVADFDNYRKRTTRELDEIRRRARQSTVKELLPVIDNLTRATAQVDENTDASSMAEGITMVMQQFETTLKKMNIERIVAVGQAFDPALHDSIQYEYSEEHETGLVMTEIQTGYRMGTDLLRPTVVVVSRGPAPNEPAAEADISAESDGAD